MILLVGGERDGETVEAGPGAGLIRQRGHDPQVGSACEGYGPMDHYGIFDPDGCWPVHHRYTTTAKVAVAFARDSPYLSTLESLAISKSPDLQAQGEAVVAAFAKWCAAQPVRA